MITLGQATRIYAEMSWMRLRRGKMVWLCLALLALPVVIAGVLAAAGQWGRGLFDSLLEIQFRFLIPFLPALLASSAVAEEIEERTFTFLFARPAPRPSLVLGKYLAIAVPLAAATALSVALSFAISMARFPSDASALVPHLLRAEAAALLGVLAFTALAIVIGAIFTRHPFVAVIGYLLIVEAGIGSLPILLNLIAVSWHLRNLAELPLPEIAFLTVQVPIWISALVPAVLGALCLGGAALSVKNAEYGGR